MDLPLAVLFSAKLQHFLAVYQFRNLRRASEEIGISQPAISKSLKSLEGELDVVLFVRSKTGMAPTVAGDVLAQLVSKISDLTRAAEIELSSIQGSGGGEIRIGAGQMWSWLFIPEIVSRFSGRFPGVTLEVTTGAMEDLFSRLRRAELDIIVGDVTGLKIPDDFQMQEAWIADFCPFSATGHPLAEEAFVEPADLVKYPWSGYVDQDQFVRYVNYWCRKIDLKPPSISIKATSMATLLRLTSAGENIALLPIELEQEVRQWGLVPVGRKPIRLWRVQTGSIVERRKASVKQFHYLLELIQRVREKPSEFMSTPHDVQK
jgi:DNA-binding transcriptional LysR family regulator